MGKKYPYTSTRYSQGPFRVAIGSAFSGPSRLWNGAEHRPMAVVTKVHADYIRVASHDFFQVEILELRHVDFVKLFEPLLVPGIQAAYELLHLCESMLIVPPVDTELQKLIIDPKEDVVPRDKTKLPSKTNATAEKFAGTLTAYGPGPRSNGRNHTCLVTKRDKEWTEYVSLYDGCTMGLVLGKTHTAEFDLWYAKSDNFPVVKLANLYFEYARHAGATKEALDVLCRVINISDQEYEMAVAKKNAQAPKADTEAAKPASEPKATKAPAVKSAAEPKAPAAKAAKVDKPAAKTDAKADTGAAKPSASARFKELIMAGNKTDDEIFALVKTEFSLSDDKRGYVKWYRNDMAKKGLNPPAAKEPKAK